jgi:hypothetical protein
MIIHSVVRFWRVLMHLFGRGPAPVRRRHFLGRGRNPGPWEDPYSGVQAPRGLTPRGRGAAAAVMEPEPDVFPDVVGRVRQDRA